MSEDEIARALRQQQASESDQTNSERDQTAADADQTASDVDVAASHDDQERADLEQLASDHDQVAADREFAGAAATSEAQDRYDVSRAVRSDASAARGASSIARSAADLGRSEQAHQRDQTASRRDLTALVRDRTAAVRDQEDARNAQALLAGAEGDAPAIRDVLLASEQVRRQGAADRARAATDRQRAATDRAQAAADRVRARDDLQRVRVDNLGELVATEDRERRRLADDLHDDALQLAMSANQDIQEILDGRSDLIEPLADTLEEIVHHLRRVTVELHPLTAVDEDLSATLQSICMRQARRGRFAATVTVDPLSAGVADHLLVRIARELITNVARHADASQLHVSVSTTTEGAQLSVIDDGIGIDLEDAATATAGGHIGLASCTQRARSNGGELTISRPPDGGTAITVTLPRTSPHQPPTADR
jgi:signal transduction histidine kinase